MYLGEEPVYLDTSKAGHNITNSWSTRLWWSITTYIGGHKWKLGPRCWSSSIPTTPVIKTKPEQLGYHVDKLDHVNAVDAADTVDTVDTVETRDLVQSDREQGLIRRSPVVWSSEWLAETTSSPAENRGSDELLKDSLDLGNGIRLEILPVGYLGNMGHYASCDIVLCLIGKLVYMVMSKIMICKRGVTWPKAIRLNMLLLTEFRNNLIQALNEQERGTMVEPPNGIEWKS